MSQERAELLSIQEYPPLNRPTLVLSLTGWMDGGDVSTGTVRRLVDLLHAATIAEIDPDPFYIFNFPGTMELAAFFRPHLRIAEGLVESMELPHNRFFCHAPANLILFIGKEPNLRWPTFADLLFEFASRLDVSRILFVGSFGGPVPHTREPRLYVTCSDPALLPEMQRYGLRRTGYEGPGSFASYLLTRAAAIGLPMTSLVAEIPGYLQGRNPASIEAVTRRLAKILQLPLDLQQLRVESTEWELQVSQLVEQDRDLAKTIRKLEDAYDDELLKLAGEVE
jgi:proteasome assembly chaperone (PAC2) family protein